MMEMIAVMPLRMTAPFTAVCGEAPNRIMVNPATAIIVIMIAVPMLT